MWVKDKGDREDNKEEVSYYISYSYSNKLGIALLVLGTRVRDNLLVVCNRLALNKVSNYNSNYSYTKVVVYKLQDKLVC